jgi:organic radical activating enzyme
MTDFSGDRSLPLAAMPDGTPEIFVSVQGEGPKMGRLSLFVRLSECNLYCRWCDTVYTWRWNERHPHEDGKIYDRRKWQQRMTILELVDLIAARNVMSVIFTGGEPLLHHRSLAAVMRMLRERSIGYEFEFETNGTIAPAREFLELVSLIVASPKLANSGMPRSVRIVPALRVLLDLPQTVLKFVVENESDFGEIETIQREFHVLAQRIWIMPRARSAGEVISVGQEIIDSVIKRGYNYSGRLHLLLFGEKQGT